MSIKNKKTVSSFQDQVKAALNPGKAIAGFTPVADPAAGKGQAKHKLGGSSAKHGQNKPGAAAPRRTMG